jgi:hypothetical protein
MKQYRGKQMKLSSIFIYIILYLLYIRLNPTDEAIQGKTDEIIIYIHLYIILYLLYIRLNPTDEEIQQMADEIDEDGSGEIEFDEFLKIMNSKLLK